MYNNRQIIKEAIHRSKADQEYYDAVKAFDNKDFDGFINSFFKAIHSKYVIEQPAAKRLIRMKLGVINRLQNEIDSLKSEINRKESYLKELAAEYLILGQECENEHMDEAAKANYRKALKLYPDAYEAKRRLSRLEKD